MDPFAAMGVAGNIVAFVDFGSKLLNMARNIHGSVSGTTPQNEQLSFLVERMQALSVELQPDKDPSKMTAGEHRLSELAAMCRQLSDDLLKLVSRIRSTKQGSKLHALRAALRNTFMHDEKEELERRLNHCREQLHLQLTQMAR